MADSTLDDPDSLRPARSFLKRPGRALLLIAGLGISAALILLLYWRANQDSLESELYLSRGIWNANRSNHDEALDAFTAAISLDPENVPAYVGRGDLYLSIGQPELAAADYSAVIERGVRFAPVFDGRGQAYLGLNDPALALADFNTALEEDPHYGISYLHRAQAYEGLGQIEAALADYERFLGAYFVDDDGLRAYAAHQIEELESAAP